MSTKMAKHGKELSDDTRKATMKLIESEHRASQVALSLKISKYTILGSRIVGENAVILTIYPEQEGNK